jgi:molybdopterin adenylyltransferase
MGEERAQVKKQVPPLRCGMTNKSIGKRRITGMKRIFKAAVITVSDGCASGVRDDLSGPAVADALQAAGFAVAPVVVVPDEVDAIAAALRTSATTADLVVTTGGTGLAARDVTPEATRLVCERLVEGLAERMRAEGVKETPLAVLSRGVCGTLGRTLILNLPGSSRGAVTSLQAVIGVLPHALDLLAGRTEHPGPKTPDGA